MNLIQTSLRDELLEQFLVAVKEHERSQWKLGDLALEAAGRLKHYADLIEFPYTTLQNYRATAAAYPESNRLDSLSWTHHFVVRRLENRMEWLHAALENGWSVSNLQDAISSGREDDDDEEEIELQAIFAPLQEKRLIIRRFCEAVNEALNCGLTVDEIRNALEEILRGEDEIVIDK